MDNTVTIVHRYMFFSCYYSVHLTTKPVYQNEIRILHAKPVMCLLVFSCSMQTEYWRRAPHYAMVEKVMQIRFKIVRQPCWSPRKVIKRSCRQWENPTVLRWCSVRVTGQYRWHKLFELAAWITSASSVSATSWKASVSCAAARSRRTEEVPAEFRCVLSCATASAGGFKRQTRES